MQPNEHTRRLQGAVEAQLDTMRAAELARVVTSLCTVGVRPRVALLERLLSLGPCPEFSRKLMSALHVAITGLLAADERAAEAAAAAAAAAGQQPASRQQAPASWVSVDVPSEGAGAAEFDAFVDAARAHLGAEADGLAGAPSSDEALGQQPPDGGRSAGWWQLAGGDEDAGGMDMQT